MIDLHFFADGLAVGAHVPMQAASRLAGEQGSRRSSTCASRLATMRPCSRFGIRLLHLPTHDTRAISQRMIRDGVAFVCAALERGERFAPAHPA